MAQGTVKWFNAEKGFGFVAVESARESAAPDVFVHYSGLDGGYRGVVEGPLRYDIELCERLRAAGCEGREWEVFARAVYTKAVKLSFRWIVEGLMFAQCRRAGRPVGAGDIDEWSRDDIKALAHDVVAENFTLFVKVGILGRDWDHRKGAALFTYFMNGVVLCFPNVFRRHLSERSRWNRVVDLHDNLDDLDRPDDSRYRTSVAQCATLLRDLLDAIGPERQREVAGLYFAEGLGIGQIADRLQLGDAATRGLLNRARQAMRRRYDGSGKEERHDWQ